MIETQAIVAHFATSILDQPHATPVWLDWEPQSGLLLVDVDERTRKFETVQKNPLVAISFTDPTDVTHWVAIRGTVLHIVVDDQARHLQSIAPRFLGRPKQRPGSRRLLKIEAQDVSWWNQ
jgi:general stress protein 26